MSRAAAWFSAVIAALLLGEVAREAIQGDLLEIKAGHIGVGSVLLLVAWLLATIYVAGAYLVPPKEDRDA
jgi:hypothetical protein